jgi:hypothetical protein
MRLIYILLFFVVTNSQAQQTKTTILRSAITSVGSTSVYHASMNKNYEIQQSIGQSSIIGQKKIGAISVQQGFLTNSQVFNINNTAVRFIDISLDIVISPNPFIDHVKINFSRKTVQDILIYVYDMNGKVLFSKKYKPTDFVIVPMRYYSLGSYLIHIQSGQRKFTEKLLKTELK